MNNYLAVFVSYRPVYKKKTVIITFNETERYIMVRHLPFCSDKYSPSKQR